MAPSPIAVSGASGHLGRGVVEHLLARGAAVLASTRSPAALGDSRAKVQRADFDQPASMVAAWAGAEVLVLVPGDAPGDRRREQHAAALAAAAEAGVRHVVYLGVLPHGDAPTLADDHHKTEELLRGSGLAWTVLRNGIYADMLVARALAEGAVVFGGGAGRVAWVAREDLAEAAAVVALAAEEHAGAILELTGPAALSLDEVGEAVAAVTGKPVPVSALDADAFAARLTAAGLPGTVIEAMRGTALAMEAGRLEQVHSALELLLGRPPRSVGDVALAAASATTAAPRRDYVARDQRPNT